MFNPFNTNSIAFLDQGQTGINFTAGQKFCAVLIQYGADSPYPGETAVAAVGSDGVPLPGSPAVSSWLNQGEAVFSATITNALVSSAFTTLNVSAMQTYSPTAATWSGGQATFTVTNTSPELPVGTQIIAGSFTPGGYNGTWSVVAQTTASVTVTMPTNPGGSATVEGSYVSVIQPGETISGSGVTAAVVLPYGSGGGTGAGGIGTYLLTAATSGGIGPTPIAMYAAPEYFYSAINSSTGALTARTASAMGDFFTVIGANKTTANAIANGWGGSLANVSMHYGIFPNTGGTPSASALTQLCNKQTDILAFNSANTITPNSLYRLNDPGIWADSGHATFTGSISGTTLTVSSVALGASGNIATGDMIAGAGIVGCPMACPHITSGSYPTFTLNTSGGTVAARTMTAGIWKPAAPIAAATISTGSISGSQLTVGSGGVTAGEIVVGHYLDGSGITTPVYIVSQLTQNPAGTYGAGGTYQLSNNANGTVPSSGTEAMTTSGVIAGGAVAPGPALTISDNGPGTTYPIVTFGRTPGTSYGTLKLSGNFDPTTLGGTPSGIQAQVSRVAGGAALSGCQTSCAWTTLSSQTIVAAQAITAASWSGNYVTFTTPSPHGLTPGRTFAIAPNATPVGYAGTYTALNGTSGSTIIAYLATNPGPFTSATLDGRWSGSLAGVPAGGPFYVSVRAANGIAYNTLSDFVNVGLAVAFEGEGQTQGMFTTAQPLGAGYSFHGASLIGQTAIAGPAPSNIGAISASGAPGPAVYAKFALGHSAQINLDPASFLGGTGNLASDGVAAFDNALYLASGYPVETLNVSRDGSPAEIFIDGYSIQIQALGTGNGIFDSICSSSAYCGSPTGQLANFAPASFHNSSTATRNLTNTLSGNSLASIFPANTTVGTNVDMAFPLTGGGSGGGAYSEIRAGSLVIKVNGVITCQDAATPTYNLQGATFACAGAAANSSWVDYATGAFSITFASPPANTASITASWTVLADPLFTGGSTPSAQTDWVGYGPANSGVVSSAITKVPGGLSAWFDDHCPNNAPGGNAVASDGWTNTYPNGAQSLASLWSYTLGTLYPSNFPQLGSAMPVMSFGYWHDQDTVFAATGEIHSGQRLRAMAAGLRDQKHVQRHDRLRFAGQAHPDIRGDRADMGGRSHPGNRGHVRDPDRRP